MAVRYSINKVDACMFPYEKDTVESLHRITVIYPHALAYDGIATISVGIMGKLKKGGWAVVLAGGNNWQNDAEVRYPSMMCAMQNSKGHATAWKAMQSAFPQFRR